MAADVIIPIQNREKLLQLLAIPSDTHQKKLEPLVSSWHKATGGYAGPNLAADAFWYGTIRNENKNPTEIALARKAVLRGMESLHILNEITGKKGVIARSLARKDLPGDGASTKTVPLFDKNKQALPIEKNNGTWREDNSSFKKYHNYVWEDSISRDMLLGWIIAYAAIWEVIANDSSIPQSYKDILKEDVLAIGKSLLQKYPTNDGDGIADTYDLQIMDADGRITYNGILHEDFVDRTYLPFFQNAPNALMALGILSAIAFITNDAEIKKFIDRSLLEQRGFLSLIHNYLVLDADNIPIINWFVRTKYSGYNMAFMGAWLSLRYWVSNQDNRLLRKAIDESLYHKRGSKNQPIEQNMAFYDFVYALAVNDPSAVQRGKKSLELYPPSPTWNNRKISCTTDQDKALCTSWDGIKIENIYEEDGKIYSVESLPLGYRVPSSYLWNSNPYLVDNRENHDGSVLLAPSDYRFAYWLSRWVFNDKIKK